MTIEGKDYLNLASNDYLGLTRHPDIIRAGIEAAELYGAGSGAARPVSGQYEFYNHIEEKFAKFKKREAVIIGASGFQINASVISALVNPALFSHQPIVLCDKFNHASIYFALKHAGLMPVRYQHNDMTHLENLLQKYASKDVPLFIITESIFSMDGDMTDLKQLVTLAKEYNAFTIVDDAHGTGIFGTDGAGLACDIPEIDVVIGTCSKAFGSFGGYVACSDDIADYLRNMAGGVIYSTTLPPFVWGCINKTLDVIPTLGHVRYDILQKAERLRSLLKDTSFDTGQSQSQIIPIILGTNEKALKAESAMREAGFFIKAIRPPTVPPNTARLRLTMTPYIEDSDSEKIIHTLKDIL